MEVSFLIRKETGWVEGPFNRSLYCKKPEWATRDNIFIINTGETTFIPLCSTIFSLPLPHTFSHTQLNSVARRV